MLWHHVSNIIVKYEYRYCLHTHFFKYHCSNFEMMRETSFISSSGTGTMEYKRIQKLFSNLVTAIENDLIDISGHLMSRGMITQENYQDFANWSEPAYARAASLMQMILNRIKLDSWYYYDFIQVLEEKKHYYNSILQKMYMYSHDVSLQRRPLSSESQRHPYSDEESQSEDESTTLLWAPHVQYEDETSPKQGQGRAKLRPRYPSNKDVNSGESICFICSFISIVDSSVCVIFFILTFWLYLFDVISLYSLLFATVMAAQLFIMLFIVIMMCGVDSVRQRQYFCVSLSVPLLIGVTCVIGLLHIHANF